MQPDIRFERRFVVEVEAVDYKGQVLATGRGSNTGEARLAMVIDLSKNKAKRVKRVIVRQVLVG
jgi:phosphate starvation-inducible protein PhoH